MLRIIDGFKTNKSIEDRIVEFGFDTLLQEVQIRENERILKRDYNRIASAQQRLRLLEQFVELFPENLAVKLSLAKEYFQLKQSAKYGIHALRAIEEQLSSDPNYPLQSLRNTEQIIIEREILGLEKERILSVHHSFHFERFFADFKDDETNANSLENLLLSVYASALLQKNVTAVEYFDTIEKLYPDAVYLNTFYAKRLERIGAEKKAKEKREIFAQWLIGEDVSVTKKEGAMRSVLDVNHHYSFVNRTALFIRTNDEREAVAEKKELEKAAAIIAVEAERGNTDFGVIESDGVYEKDGAFYHVLKKNKGVVLLQQLEDKTNPAHAYYLLERTVQYLPVLHNSMLEVIVISHSDTEKLGERLYGRLLKTAHVIENKELFDSLLVLSSFFRRCFVTYNKDAHPENWLVETVWDKNGKKEKIIAIDFQQKEAMPQVFDIANLLDYGKYATIKEKKMLVRSYYDYFEKYHGFREISPPLSAEEFFGLYLHARVYRAMSFFCAWQHPRKIGMLTRLPILLENGIEAIDLLQNEYNNFFCFAEKNNWEKIEKAYIIIKDELTSLLKIAYQQIPSRDLMR